MKLLVPLMIPAIHSIRFAVRPSRSALMIGMPPATAASNATITPAFCAAADRSHAEQADAHRLHHSVSHYDNPLLFGRRRQSRSSARAPQAPAYGFPARLRESTHDPLAAPPVTAGAAHGQSPRLRRLSA